MAIDQGNDAVIQKQLGDQYYQVRQGIGFNKTPEEYGAFPTDPYSHTPGHSGAQQPGMTGQVKEEIITRFGELGIRISNGSASFQPNLLRKREFISKPEGFTYIDVNEKWHEIQLPRNALAFTWCQVPIVYQLSEKNQLHLELKDGEKVVNDQLKLSNELSNEIFVRSGKIKQITVYITESSLFNG